LTLLKQRCGINVAVSFRNDLETSTLLRILWVERDVESGGWKIFKTHKDKGYSFTDCTSFALMETQAIRNAFTFDRHFAQYGFNILP